MSGVAWASVAARRTAATSVVFLTLVAPALARAEIAYDILPSLSLGATDNAAAAPPWNNPKSDEFTIVNAVARAHTLSAHASHQLGFRFADTFYWHKRGPTTLTLELAEMSDVNVSPRWHLRLAAGATYGRTSSPSALDVNGGVPVALPARANPFILGAATEEGHYLINLRSRFIQALRISGVHYIREGQPAPVPGLPPPIDYSYVPGATLRYEHDVGENLVLVQGDVADSIAPGRGPGLADQVLLTQLLGGWGRQLGFYWNTEVRAGALGVFDFQGTKVIEPAGIATIGYRQVAWYVTLSASQLAVPNVFIAAATISDQVAARLALPLSRSERYYVLGYGGYTYARLTDIQGLHRGYDLRFAGVSFTARHEHIPLWASVDYTYSSQIGNTSEGGTIPDLERQAVMLTVGYAFSTDHEQPPVFHGLMPAVLPMRDDQTKDETDGGKIEAPTPAGTPNQSLPPDPSRYIDNVTR